MPEISVIVATYNSGKTLEECLKSIRACAYKNYELIIIDDGSRDATLSIAKKYADSVIELHGTPDRTLARIKGIEASSGRVIVNVDSDVVIKQDTLFKIDGYLKAHPEVSAVTGLLSKECPAKNYFSQYKNLYMNFIFKRLPENVSFLYGSIFGIRRENALTWRPDDKLAEDTALGQEIVARGGKIAFLKDLEVTHLKEYDLRSFVINDFSIPFHWANIFVKHQGWKQLGRNKTGFAHSPKSQLASVVLAPVIFILVLAGLITHQFMHFTVLLALVWSILNLRFLRFFLAERGLLFTIAAFFTTLADNIIMSCGILCGFAVAFRRKLKSSGRKNIV